MTLSRWAAAAGSDPKIPAGARLLAIAIDERHQGVEVLSWLRADAAQALGSSERSVTRWIACLVASGWLAPRTTAANGEAPTFTRAGVEA